MKRAMILAVPVLLLAACPKPAPPASPSATPAPAAHMPFEAKVWTVEKPLDVDRNSLLEKDGILKRPKPSTDDDSGRAWPFAIDYWGIARTDLEALLAPYVGRPVRIRGHFKKIDTHGQWTYEVEPESIVLLPDAPPPKPAP